MTKLPAPLHDARKEPNVGLWLSLALSLAILALATTALLTPAHYFGARFDEKHRVSEMPDTPAVSSIPVPVTSPPSLPGFQMRGTSLVGEFTARDNSRIRLVVDSKTHRVIGAKVLDESKDVGLR